MPPCCLLTWILHQLLLHNNQQTCSPMISCPSASKSSKHTNFCVCECDAISGSDSPTCTWTMAVQWIMIQTTKWTNGESKWLNDGYRAWSWSNVKFNLNLNFNWSASGQCSACQQVARRGGERSPRHDMEHSRLAAVEPVEPGYFIRDIVDSYYFT